MTWLACTAARHPGAPALVQDATTLTYADLAAEAAGGALELAARGIPGGSLALWNADANLASIAWLHAAWWHGMTILPIAPTLHAGRIDALRRRFSAVARLAGGGSGRIDASRAPVPADPDRHPPLPSTTPTLMLTSGSGAEPKAVPLNARHHEASVSAIRRRLRLGCDDRWLLALPLDHIGGLAVLVRAVLTGSAVTVHGRFDPDAVLRACKNGSVTRTSLVPTMLHRLVDRADGPIDSKLVTVLVGGAPCDPVLLARARRLGIPALPTWGMTEAASQLATMDPDRATTVDWERRPGLVGPPLDGVEIRIDDEGRTDPDGDGEILVRGPMLFEGYRGGDEHARAVRDGWFRTGDRGRLDDDGCLYVSGRERDRIISGGVNVSAPDLERALMSSRLVSDAAVVGLPDAHWGQCVCAVVVPAAGHGDDSALIRLREWAEANLRAAERPRRWALASAVPRTTAGKPDRRQLEAMFEATGPTDA